MVSKLQEDIEICEVCKKRIIGVKNAHHIMNGNGYRKKCDEDNLIIYLHPTCHMWLHNHPISMRAFKMRAQRYYEKEIGTRRQFIKRYGKSYL